MEGNGYQVTWTFGHLCELKDPGDYTPHWQHWQLADLPMVPPRFAIRLKDDPGVRKQFAVIERLMQAADGIINCGDAGQEGELIQRWVMQKAGARCPVQRLWISSMTDEAIRQGFAQLRPQADYDRLYMAALCRAIGDWLLGMNCTRLYTLKYRRGGREVLSVGRVQTPTLALVVKRQREIEQFKPVPYWVLSTRYRNTTFLATQGRFASEEEGQEALARVEGKPFIITDIKQKSGTESPPRLYDLTSLQVDCNKQFGFSAEHTLQLVQQLYEKKLTTYPRVDTTFLPEDIHPKCRDILRGLDAYATYTQPLFNQQTLPKPKKVFDTSKVTDHHAIIPTGQPARGLSDGEWKVYDLIARTFIAAFYPPCRFSATTVLGRIEDLELTPEGASCAAAQDGGAPVPAGRIRADERLGFKATGKQITDPGWRILFTQKPAGTPEGNAREAQEETILPAFVVGERGPHVPTLSHKQTQPPPFYTEATLLRAMETAGKLVDDETLRDALKENGIGRPSTRAAIIETLYKRQYIRKERKHIVATPTGQELIDIIHEDLLKSAELTGRWEKKLREIEHGECAPQPFIDALKEMLYKVIAGVLADDSNRSIAQQPQDPGENKQAGNSQAASPANGAPAGFRPVKGKRAPKASPPAPTAGGWEGLPCPLCRQGTIIKGHTAYGCSRWREGCSYRRPLA